MLSLAKTDLPGALTLLLFELKRRLAALDPDRTKCVKIKVNEVLDHSYLSQQDCILGYFAVCSVKEICYYKDKTKLPSS